MTTRIAPSCERLGAGVRARPRRARPARRAGRAARLPQPRQRRRRGDLARRARLAARRRPRARLRRPTTPGFCAARAAPAAAAGGTILLHGGGNFGDLWPIYQRFREHVIAAFPDHRIVQLPQTVHFRDAACRWSAPARCCSATPTSRSACATRGSERIARERLGVRAVLTCDMAFALGPLRAGSRAARGAAACCAPTRSASRRRPAPAGVEVDWPEQGPRWRALRQATR